MSIKTIWSRITGAYRYDLNTVEHLCIDLEERLERIVDILSTQLSEARGDTTYDNAELNRAYVLLHIISGINK